MRRWIWVAFPVMAALVSGCDSAGTPVTPGDPEGE